MLLFILLLYIIIYAEGKCAKNIIMMDFLRSVNIAPLDATPHQLFAKDFVPQVSIILKLFSFHFHFQN